MLQKGDHGQIKEGPSGAVRPFPLPALKGRPTGRTRGSTGAWSASKYTHSK